MKLRVSEAQALFNARKRRELGVSKLTREQTLKGIDISRKLFPHRDDNNAQGAYQKNIINGKRFAPEVVNKLCEIFEVDNNFLFGRPSIHDKDFDSLVMKKKTP